MNEVNGYYQISIHPSRINYYYTPFQRRSKKQSYALPFEDSNNSSEKTTSSCNSVASAVPEQFKSNSHNGKISKIAAAKITRAIDYLVYLSQPKKLPHTVHGKGLSFRLNFVTLTLSSKQIHSDHEIMSRIFRPFLMALNRNWKVNNYIWRAERQANGSIHFHVVTDRFIPWNELRNVWNRCQQHLGYVSRYRENQVLWHREGFHLREELLPKWSAAKQRKAYREGILHDWANPNSTDVHSIKLISNVKAYFSKYMTKSGQSSDIVGRLWGCSSQLSQISGAQVAVFNKIDEDLSKVQSDRSIKVVQTEYFTIIFVTILQLIALGCTELLIIWNEYLNETFPVYRPPGLF